MPLEHALGIRPRSHLTKSTSRRDCTWCATIPAFALITNRNEASKKKENRSGKKRHSTMDKKHVCFQTVPLDRFERYSMRRSLLGFGLQMPHKETHGPSKSRTRKEEAAGRSAGSGRSMGASTLFNCDASRGLRLSRRRAKSSY